MGNLDKLKNILNQNNEIEEAEKLNPNDFAKAVVIAMEHNRDEVIKWFFDPESGIDPQSLSKVKELIYHSFVELLDKSNIFDKPYNSDNSSKELHKSRIKKFTNLVEKNKILNEEYQLDENEFFYVWTKICDRINNAQNLKFIKFILKDLKNETEDSKLNKKLKKYLYDKKEMISENLDKQITKIEERKTKNNESIARLEQKISAESPNSSYPDYNRLMKSLEENKSKIKKFDTLVKDTVGIKKYIVGTVSKFGS